jgi:manganese-dependent inorganic pyrophosphatase
MAATAVLPAGTCVIGHANPDTDSICSAIAYAHFRRLSGDALAYPARQGELRPDTAWVLERFQVESPVLVTDVRPRLADVMSAPVITAPTSASLLEVARTLRERGLRSLPIVDHTGALAGVVSLEDFARLFLEGVLPADTEDLPLDLDTLVRAIDGTVLVAARDRPISDKVRVAASSIRIVLERVPPDGIAVVGDRQDIQEALIYHGVGALIVTGGLAIAEHVVQLAREHHVTLISCPHHTYATVRLINMSVPASFVMRPDPVSAQPGDFVADIRPHLATQRLVPVVDRQRRPVGMFTRSDLLRPTRRRVVLVDHNEPSQAVAGLEEAEVVGIIDHHRINTIQTPTPIVLRCEPVGATATIVAELYHEAGFPVPEAIAGLLLAAIVTDTVIFRSPTSTERDRAVVAALARITSLDPEDFGREIFSRASDIRGLSPSRVLTRDFKEFPVHGNLYGIASIETGNTAALQVLREALRTEMERLRRTRPYEVVLCMIVDVLQEQTEIMICGHEEVVAATFDRPLLDGPLITLPYVASRKKQIVPLLDEIDASIRAGHGAGQAL